MTFWATGINAAVGLGTAWYGTQQQKKSADKMAKASQVIPYNVNSPFGNVFFDPASRQVQFQQFENPFYNLLSQGGLASLSNAFTAAGSPYAGASPEVIAAAEGLRTENLQADAADRYGLLTQLAQPEQQRSYNNLQDTLFSQGRLGTTGGGVQQEAWQNAANRADLERQLAGQDWATQRAQNRFSTALQAVNQGSSMAQDQFTMGQNARAGMDNIFAQLANTGNMGLSAGGAPSSAALQAQYQARSGVAPAIYGAVQNSGLLDAFTGWAGNRLGGWFGTPGGMSDAQVRAAVPLDFSFSGMKLGA